MIIYLEWKHYLKQDLKKYMYSFFLTLQFS